MMRNLLCSISAVLIFLIVGGGAFQPSKEAITADTSSWNRRDALKSITSVGTMVAFLTGGPQNAIAAANNRALAYQGVYSDPNHPKGYRVLIGDNKSATLKLQDSPKEPTFELPVKVAMDQKTKQVQLAFDFSPKGGPKDVVGVLGEKTGDDDTTTTTIISFPDGNSWKKETSGIIGVYTDSLGPNSFVSIRQWTGAELRVELIDGAETTATFGAKAGSRKAFFEYPGEFNKAGFINTEDHTITFRDGNVWTRF